MSQKYRPIPTPLAYRWRRFVQQGLPAVMFVCVALLTLWLWDRQASMGNAVGSVEALRVDVPAGVDGLVQVAPRGTWNRFDTVQADETLAVITAFSDSSPRAQLNTIRARIKEVQSSMLAEQARMQLELELTNANSQVDRDRRGDQIEWQIERLRLDILDKQAILGEASQDLKRLNARDAFLTNSLERGAAVSEQEVLENKLARDALQAKITKGYRAVDERKEQLQVEWTRHRKKSAGEAGLESEMQKATREILAPFSEKINVLKAQMFEVQAGTETLEVKAPISGEVTMVHAYPGQAVQAGDPIVTIAKDSGRYIVSYLRSDQRIRVEPNMEVLVREKRSGARPIRTTIADVGPQVEPVPLHHLRDPGRPEWGLPVTIELPAEIRVRPGELIDIIFSSRTARRTGQ